MELTEARIISVLSLGLGSLIIGLLPFWFNKEKRQNHPLLISVLLCFGGGVLLSTSLVHILPEVRETIANYRNYAEVIFCVGFFLLYLLDEIMHFFYDTHTENHNFDDFIQKNDINRRSSYGATERDPLMRRSRQLPFNPVFYKARSDSELFKDGPPTSQLCHVGHQEPCNYGPVVSIGLLLALSVHAILEGLVIGLESASSKVLLLLGAVASHKLVVSFCLGIELASNPKNGNLKNTIGISIFALGSVAGIIIGVFISKLPPEITDLPIPVLQALAGGTLLYVTVSEVIPRERARWHQNHQKFAGLVQLIAICVGFTSMTALSMYLGD